MRAEANAGAASHRLAAMALALAALLLAPAAARAQATSAGLVPIVPCRMMDTRLSTTSYPYPYGAPGFTPLSKRTLPVTGSLPGANPCSNVIPGGGVVTALSVNLTVVSPSALGDLREVPGTDPGGNLPTSIMNFPGGIFAIANAATIPVANDQITLQEVGANANVLLDVMGYYTSTLSSFNPVVAGINDGTGLGVYGYSAASNGVRGVGLAADGVQGLTLGSGAIAGVHGSGPAAYGVYGETTSGVGVYGKTSSTGAGLVGEGNGAGTEALRVTNGALRITGAQPAAFQIHVVTGAGGNACAPVPGFQLMAAIGSPYSDGDPNALIFATETGGIWIVGHALAAYYADASAACAPNQWLVYHMDGSDVSDGEWINVLIVKR